MFTQASSEFGEPQFAISTLDKEILPLILVPLELITYTG
jgi:hypothetical protein